MNIRQTEGKFLSVDEFTERKNSLQEEDERSVSSCSQRTGCTDHSSAVLQDHPSSEVHVLNNRDIGSCEDLTSTPSIVSDDTESFYSVDSSFSRQNTTESDETLNSSRSSLSTCSFHSTDTVKSTDLYYSTTNVNSDNAINDTCSNFNNTSSVSYDLLSTDYKMDSGSDVSQLGEKQELKIKPKKSLISSLRKGKKQVKRTKSDITSLEVPIKKNDRDTKSDDEFPEDGSLGELGSETLSADDGSFSEVNDGTKLKVKAYERSPKIKSPKKDSTLKRSFFRKKDKDSRILKQSSEHSDALDTDNSIIDIEGADDNDSLSLSPKNLPKSLPAPSDQQGEIPHPIIKKENVGSETIKPTNDQSIASLSSKIIVRQSSAGSSLVGSEKLQSTEKPAKDDTDVVVLQKPEKLEEISIPISLSETKVNAIESRYLDTSKFVNKFYAGETKQKASSRLSPDLIKRFSPPTDLDLIPASFYRNSSPLRSSSSQSDRSSRPVTPIASNEPPHPVSFQTVESNNFDHESRTFFKDEMVFQSLNKMNTGRQYSDEEDNFEQSHPLGISFEDIDIRLSGSGSRSSSVECRFI